MPSQFILHIGANKTGSSAIQNFLKLNFPALRKLNFAIPDRELGGSDRVTGEHVFALQNFFNSADTEGLTRSVRNLLELFPDKSVILSAENLSNQTNYEYFKPALEGVDSKVILYIRRQDELLMSSWQQWYSKREVDLNAWLIGALQKYGHWLKCIEGWESVVGEGNVTVRVFQRSDLVGGDVVDDFASVLGLDLQGQSLKKPKGIVNPSYSDLITPIVSGNRYLFPHVHDDGFYNMVGALTGDFYTSQNKISLISAAQREKIAEFYDEENTTICKRFFEGRARLFEKIDHSKYKYLAEDEMARQQMSFVLSLTYAMYKKL